MKQARRDEKHGMEEAREGKRGWDRRSETREGHDKIIPKNDME